MNIPEMAADLEVSTPLEHIPIPATSPSSSNNNNNNNHNGTAHLDQLLAHASNNNRQYAIMDRCGIRISFSGLLPLTEGENGEEIIWGSSIILNSEGLEFPSVEFKLRAQTKKSCRNRLTCNRSKGIIKQNDLLVLTYQLTESAIEYTNLTLLVDSSPHEVPLYKIYKSDFYWIGKETNVPTAKQLYEKLKGEAPNMDVTPKHISPGRLENIPDGLRAYLMQDNGFLSICKILQPHAVSLFRELAESGEAQKKFSSSIDFSSLTGFDKSSNDVFAEEIVRRFHEHNRLVFTTTPTMIQETKNDSENA